MGDLGEEEVVSTSSTVGRWVIQTERIINGNENNIMSKGKGMIVSLFQAHVWIKIELVTLTKLAVPIILSLIFQNLLLMISLIFVGHISDRSLELDSAALSSSFANITGISVGIGLSSAADTLCSQVYGYKNYKKVGHIFQRGVLILFLLTLFIWAIWLNTESILLLIQQSPCVAKFSGTYVQIFTLSLPPFFVYWMLQKYLQAQSIVWPFIFTGLLSNVASVIFHAIFVIWADLGVNGASLAMVLSYYCFPLFLIIYVRIRKLHTKTWDGWSWESLRGWGQFFRLGVPGVAMTCLEWVSYEIAAFVLGSISEVELAVNSIMVNVIILLFMVPLGISIAAGVRVGNELGAAQPKSAKRASYIASVVVFVNTVLQIILLQLTKTYFGRIYTNDEEVLERLPSLIDVLCVLLIADQLQLSLRGVIIGCGHQLTASVINFIAFYIIGLPIGISLSLLTDLGSRGMWSGLTVGAYFQLFCLLVLMFRLNWKKESEKAILRSQDNNQESISDKSKEGEDETGMITKKEDDLDSISTSSDDNVCLLQVAVSNNNKDDMIVEEIQLNELTSEDTNNDQETLLEKEEDDEQTNHDTLLLDSASPQSFHSTRSHIKLLLSKGSVYLIGIALVVVAGIVSQFHPPDTIINGNYTECLGDIDPTSVISSSSSVDLVVSSPILDLYY